MALIFALPSLGVFLGIFYGVGNLPLAAILGFGTHFVILAFSNRIAKYLDKVLN
jgi:1,4-dihydroxy-2-naphthoate octaprenyltransferase|tara:strand:- start:761 stop:922 length:162 start_codon:yes stop_codon:yes gene_type:complete